MKTINIYLILLTLVAGMTSCEKWFDVSPKADVKAEDLFKQESGFRDVLTGVYSLMATDDTYGKNLTFGYVDALAQYYDKISGNSHEFIKTIAYLYDEPVDKAEIESIWSTQYKAIANLNSILMFIDQNRNVFSSDIVYRLYKGETLGLRAMLHFDLLRLYGPSVEMGLDLQAIPYLEAYTNAAQPRLTVAQVLEKIVRDLNGARDLLRDADTFGPKGEELKKAYPQAEQFKNRANHLNYYAATALLARVEMYAGESLKALAAAKEIIGEPGDDPVAPFRLTSAVATDDRLFADEVLFQLEMLKLKDVIDGYFGEGAVSAGTSLSTTILAFSKTKRDKLYASVNSADDDFRLKLWFQATDKASILMPGKYKDMKMIPLIRLSELYYIAAECTSASNQEVAWAYLNKLRAHRGLVALVGATNLQNEIYKEYCKEFLSEGQVFYYYKRKNLSSIGVNKTVTIDNEKVFILPLPVNEQDFGNGGSL